MDIKIPLAFMLIAGGAIGLALPAADDAGGKSGPLAARTQSSDFSPQREPRSPQTASETMWIEEMVLDREPDGHFYANVEVDGRSYRMLVDTGASVVALSEGDADDMGLEWFDDDVEVVAQGASGPVQGINLTIDRMSLGMHEASDVSAVIIPAGTPISLLGQSFLSTLVSVEITGDRMVLGS